MNNYTIEDLKEGIKAMESLIHKCEKAQLTIVQGSPQWTTLSRRLKAFRMAHSVLSEQLAQGSKKENA